MKKFFLEITPLGVKTCGESEFDIFEAKNASMIQGRPVCIEAKSRKNAIFATFRFNPQAFLESRKHFFIRKCQIRIPRMFFTPRGIISRKKILKIFFTWVPRLR